MTQEEIITDILVSAARARVSVPAACVRAEIAPSTFYRWQKGSQAALTRMLAVRAAVDALEAERQS